MTDQDKELQNQPQDPDPNSQDSWQEGPKEQAPQNDWQAQPQDPNPQGGWQNQPQNTRRTIGRIRPRIQAHSPAPADSSPHMAADSRLTGRTPTAMGSRLTDRTLTAMGSRLTDRTLTATGSSLTGRTPTAMDSRPTDRITPTAAAPGPISRIEGPNRPSRKTAMRPFPLYPGFSAC